VAGRQVERDDVQALGVDRTSPPLGGGRGGLSTSPATRHPYERASMMLSAGEHPMWVAKQMGHTDWTMIARVYGRWMPSANEHAGQKGEMLWNNSLDTTPHHKSVVYEKAK